jgi:hypothetical protein
LLTLQTLPGIHRSSSHYPPQCIAAALRGIVRDLADSSVPEYKLARPEWCTRYVGLRAMLCLEQLLDIPLVVQSQSVAVYPQYGVLSLVPDSLQWFDWLVFQTSFRIVEPPDLFSACRASEKSQYTCSWAARLVLRWHTPG